MCSQYTALETWSFRKWKHTFTASKAQAVHSFSSYALVSSGVCKSSIFRHSSNKCWCKIIASKYPSIIDWNEKKFERILSSYYAAEKNQSRQNKYGHGHIPLASCCFLFDLNYILHASYLNIGFDRTRMCRLRQESTCTNLWNISNPLNLSHSVANRWNDKYCSNCECWCETLCIENLLG